MAQMRKLFEPVVGDVQQSREVPLLALVTLLPAVLGHWKLLTNLAPKTFASRDDSAVSLCLEVGGSRDHRNRTKRRPSQPPSQKTRYRFKFQSNLVWGSIKSISNF
jgi:hypothetical protein